MDINKMNVGDCFTRSTDNGKIIGFLLLNVGFMQDKNNNFKFAVVYFKDNEVSSINDFKKGEIFTHNVYLGVKGDYKMGIYCYDVDPKSSDFFNKLKFKGNFKINEAKFVCGSATNYTNEFFFNLNFNFIEQSKIEPHYRKEKLSRIMFKM